MCDAYSTYWKRERERKGKKKPVVNVFRYARRSGRAVRWLLSDIDAIKKTVGKKIMTWREKKDEKKQRKSRIIPCREINNRGEFEKGPRRWARQHTRGTNSRTTTFIGGTSGARFILAGARTLCFIYFLSERRVRKIINKNNKRSWRTKKKNNNPIPPSRVVANKKHASDNVGTQTVYINK